MKRAPVAAQSKFLIAINNWSPRRIIGGYFDPTKARDRSLMFELCGTKGTLSKTIFRSAK